MNIQELENLLKDYQKYLPESDEGKQKKSQLIGYLSSSYWWHSQYITNLFPVNVKQVKEGLMQELEDTFNKFTSKNYNYHNMAKLLLQETLVLHKKYQKQLITDDFINTLAAQVKIAQHTRYQKNQIVQCLIKAIDIKNAYKKQGLGAKFNLSPQDYEEAFQEAKGESIRYVLDNIDKYDEERGDFMALLNYWIPIKFLDAAGKILGLKKSQMNKEDEIKISSQDPNSKSMVNHLNKKAENIYKEFACNRNSEEIKNLIQEDPNNKLGKSIRKDRTDITFKDVLIAINWEGQTFKDLSRKWEIPYTTIKSFYEREFKVVEADLADYLQ